jgi:hypothetical protein
MTGGKGAGYAKLVGILWGTGTMIAIILKVMNRFVRQCCRLRSRGWVLRSQALVERGRAEIWRRGGLYLVVQRMRAASGSRHI